MITPLRIVRIAPLRTAGTAGVLLTVVATFTLSRAASALAGQPFISRDDARIVEDGKPFDYVGGNLPEVTHIRTDWDLREASRMRLPTREEIDYLVAMAAQSHMRVIRTWCFPNVYDRSDAPHDVSYFWKNDDGRTVTLNEEAFRLFDHFLARCREHGLRVTIPFFYKWDDWNWPDGDRVDPQQADFIRQVLTRVNTVTGVPYCDDPTIYAWANGNEFRRTPRGWIQAVAALVKKHAPRQLFIDARMAAQEIWDAYAGEDRTLLDDPNIDIVSYHLYEPRANGWDVHRTMAEVNAAAAKGSKALLIGEISPRASAGDIEKLIATVSENQVHAILYWSWKGIKAQGGYMQWNGKSWGPNDDLKWPGFPFDVPGVAPEKAKVDALVAGHFALAGKERPPLAAPAPATLLPTVDAGHISWLPGVGEQTAVIERSADGQSFTEIAKDYPTGLSGHATMFADPAAKPGESWFYRVRARNAGGTAEPSNVVGPVRVTHRWLVDDLWDRTRLAKASEGARFTADANSVPYHNDLAFVSSAGGEQFLEYAVEAPVNQVTVLSNNDTNTLRVLGSRDGETFEPVPTTRLIYPPLHKEFAGHPRVLTTSVDVTDRGYRHVRVAFADGDVLSRIEIASAGADAPPPPELLVDDSDPGFRFVGDWQSTRDPQAVAGGINFTHHQLPAPSPDAAAEWSSPVTTAGRYAVFLRWPGAEHEPSHSATLPVEIVHADGTARVTVNQQWNPTRWHRLGEWTFDGAPGQLVRLRPDAAAAADAVRWVPVP